MTTILERMGAGKAAERELVGQLLATLQALQQTTTELAAYLGGRAVNGVLEVRTYVFDATGQVYLRWGVTAGAITVDNLSAANTVTVTSGPPESGPPTSGTGVYPIKFGQRRTVPLASRRATLYGTTGDTVTVVVFAAGPDPVLS